MIDLKDDLSIVIFGETSELTKCYRRPIDDGRVSSVKVSVFSDYVYLGAHDNLSVIYNARPAIPGESKRNNDIVLAYNGILGVSTRYTLVVRAECLPTMNLANIISSFEEKFNDSAPVIFTSKILENPMSVDVSYLISTTKLIKAFWQCPLDSYDGPSDYSACIRPEAYFVCNHLKLISTAACDALLYPQIYLYDNATKRDASISTSKRVLPKYFTEMGI